MRSRLVARSAVHAAVLGAVLLLLAIPAAAHSDLVATEPAADARLEAAPAWVVLRFSNPIEASASAVTIHDGQLRRVDQGDLETTTVDGRPVLNVSLEPALGDGAYTVRWSIISEDGHPNSGRFGFAVGNASVPPATAADSPRPEATAVAGRVLSYAGLALGLGAIAWLWLVRASAEGMARPASQALAAGGLLHAAGALALFLATRAEAGVDASVLATLDTGRLLLVRMGAGVGACLLALAGLRPRVPSRVVEAMAALLLVVACLATAGIGHAASHGLPGLFADTIHLVASAMWVGGLALLLLALRRAVRQGTPVDAIRRTGLRFGTVALACVLLLATSGTATALIVLGQTAVLDPLHLTGSLYGQLLLAKVALAALMVALAGANRFLYLAPTAPASGWRGRLAALGPDGTARGLRRTLLAEALLGLAVLVVAGALTAVSPSGHEEHAHDGHVAPVAATGQAIGAAALITPRPHGDAMASFGLLHHDGAESGVDWVDVTLGVVIVVVLAAIAFGIYKLVQRRSGD